MAMTWTDEMERYLHLVLSWTALMSLWQTAIVNLLVQQLWNRWVERARWWVCLWDRQLDVTTSGSWVGSKAGWLLFAYKARMPSSLIERVGSWVECGAIQSLCEGSDGFKVSLSVCLDSWVRSRNGVYDRFDVSSLAGSGRTGDIHR